MLLSALKRNSSLWQVTADLREDRLEGDTAAMEFYAKRNKRIYAILEATMEQVRGLLASWPRIFRDMRGCEMEASMILVALTALGDLVGPRESRLQG